MKIKEQSFLRIFICSKMGNLPSTSQFDNSEVINLADMSIQNLPFNPSFENKAKYLYLSGNHFQSLSTNMRNVITVDLSNNYLGPTLPFLVSRALKSYKNLESLELSKNQIESFENFENACVEKVNLLQNRFKELPDNFFSKFPNLKTLHFDFNFLRTLQNQSSSSLTTLTMSLNCIEVIDASSLNFAQLTFLDLSKNKITKVPNNLSKSFPKLENLNLSNNFISEIPENDDSNSVFPETLKVLDLSNNLLDKITNSITNLPNLVNLNVENNKITNLPQLNQSIKKLKASNNKICSVKEQELKSLKDIDLSNNEIASFPTEIKMLKGNSILLKRNQMSEINCSIIPISKVLSSNITVIDISFNQISTIPKEIFEELPNLHTFYAFFNNITSIPSEIINCKALYTIGISYNPIKKFPKLPNSLDRIIASNCQIDSFDLDLFADTNNLFLTSVDLSGNNLESFPSFTSLQILNLSHNKLKKLPSITENLRILDVSMNSIESDNDSMPQIISGESITELNLSYNKLTKLPEFKKVPLLQTLEFSGNSIQGTFDASQFRYLKRIDVTETQISIINASEVLKEIISSSNTKDEKNVYVNQQWQDNRNKNNKKNKNDRKSGYAETIGLRNNMEDSIIVRDDLNLYAVCDGHGGPETAKFASIKIPELFEAKKPFSFNKLKEIIPEILKQTDEELKKMELNDGSTLCLASLFKNENGNKKVVTCNLGDARALIVKKDGKSRELTKDHKPSMRSEFERVHNQFGKVSNDRIDGVLGVARGLGDFNIFGVGKKPDVCEFDIDENDRYLVIACDGVFDSLTNDDVAKVAMNASSVTDAAFNIRNAAFGALSGDNISVIVVDLSYV